MAYAHGSNIRILSATIMHGCSRLRTGGHLIETTGSSAIGDKADITQTCNFAALYESAIGT